MINRYIAPFERYKTRPQNIVIIIVLRRHRWSYVCIRVLYGNRRYPDRIAHEIRSFARAFVCVCGSASGFCELKNIDHGFRRFEIISYRMYDIIARRRVLLFRPRTVIFSVVLLLYSARDSLLYRVAVFTYRFVSSRRNPYVPVINGIIDPLFLSPYLFFRFFHVSVS